MRKSLQARDRRAAMIRRRREAQYRRRLALRPQRIAAALKRFNRELERLRRCRNPLALGALLFRDLDAHATFDFPVVTAPTAGWPGLPDDWPRLR